MFKVLDVLVDDALATTRFACDLGACKGACCTMPGGRGAPLDDEEVEPLTNAIPAALPYLSERNRRVIRTIGALEGAPGDMATRCIDNRDCVFVYYEGEVAKCAIERAHFDGKTEFRKPISCHLFPIRSNELFGGEVLHYERITECKPALKRGERKDVPLYVFLKEAIVRAYGQEFYSELLRTIKK
jgi:hypothetical protein